MSQYALHVTEENLDLIEFLNDGVRPELEEKFTYFVFSILSPREISAKIEFEDDLYDENGHLKDTRIHILM